MHDEESEGIRWNLVAGAVIVTTTMACAGFVISLGNRVSAGETKIQMLTEDVKDLKNSTHPATSKRYSSDDAARDLDLIRVRIKEAAEDMRRRDDDIQRRLQRIEDRLVILGKR